MKHFFKSNERDSPSGEFPRSDLRIALLSGYICYIPIFGYTVAQQEQNMESSTDMILWWHWVILGLILMPLELALPSFVALWLGAAAVVVGVADYFFSTSLTAELIIWVLLSTLFLTLWHLKFKKEAVSNIGQSDDELAGIRGRITAVKGDRSYTAEFELPVLGDRTWTDTSESELREGDAVTPEQVIGQILKVKKEQ